MTHIERARLKPGRLIEWQGRHFVYQGYGYKAHILKEGGVSRSVTYQNGTVIQVPVYEYLSKNEILDATVGGQT
jgi:hypothetical protein